MITIEKTNRLLEILAMSEMQQHSYLNWLKDQIFPKDGVHWEPFVEQGFVEDCEFLGEATQYPVVKLRIKALLEKYSTENT